MLFRVFKAANIVLGAFVRIFRYGHLVMSYVAIPVCLHVAIFVPQGSDTLGQGRNPPFLCVSLLCTCECERKDWNAVL